MNKKVVNWLLFKTGTTLDQMFMCPQYPYYLPLRSQKNGPLHLSGFSETFTDCGLLYFR